MVQDKGMHSTVGAALAGCLISVGLSAVLGFQTFLYFQVFPMDKFKYKLLVGVLFLVTWVWLFDAAHTILICTSIWQYAVNNFTNPNFVEEIVPTLAINVAMTAITTVTVNVFYAWRIHKMSNGNWALTWLIGALLFARTGLALVTTVEMILTKTFANFAANFNTVLTAGLSVSAATDIVVSLARYYYLRNLQQGYSGSQEMVDAVVVFTINDGCLTCAVVIATITCLLRMPDNFIWLGIYFTIAKLYSNSVLATLNLRNWYRHQRPMGIPLTHQRPQAFRSTITSHNASRVSSDRKRNNLRPTKEIDSPSPTMQVFVDQQVEYNVTVSHQRRDTEDARSLASM
ncbi:hypothetical protein GGX14DRAFT_698190 [Mycena pura]|uniref:DUF6534 domain-containing protein n=1 Tax=Mycena pura TaxID=153505 RepID=A0AAD6VCN7_9AGAR|nr:hypothetical protein GGX14DRAFT_698190 [Mycena pura]